MGFKTEQEEFWSGEFGNDYIERNQGDKLLATNIAMFSKVLDKTTGVKSVIEFGSNIGMNLKAINTLLPSMESIGAIEINKQAADILKQQLPQAEVYNTSMLEYEVEKKWDFVLIKGVLIHINPDELTNVYRKLYESSNKYICIAEYYNPTPVTINYRGFENRLFKRDFAGEMLDMYEDLELVDYGFSYHRDNNFKGDDITWFLLQKK